MLAMDRRGGGVGLQRRRRRGGDPERDDRAARGHRRTPPRRAARAGRPRRPAAHEGRHDPDPGRPRLGAAHVPRGWAAGSVGVGPVEASRAILARVSRPRPLPEPDLDAEQEVDLRSAWSRIAARWWLPVLGLALGVVVGYLLALGGGQVYRAETLVYLGVPFTPGGGGVIPNSIATNPRIVGEIVRSEAALRAASRASGIPVSKLRGSISTRRGDRRRPGPDGDDDPLRDRGDGIRAGQGGAGRRHARAPGDAHRRRLRRRQARDAGGADRQRREGARGDQLALQHRRARTGGGAREPVAADHRAAADRHEPELDAVRARAAAEHDPGGPPERAPARHARDRGRAGEGRRAGRGAQDDCAQHPQRRARRRPDRPAARLRRGAPRRSVPGARAASAKT